MTIDSIMSQLKAAVSHLYGPRLADVVLFGSWARDQAHDDSDIDVMIVLKGSVVPGREIDRMIDVITDLNLEHDILIAPLPVSAEAYLAAASPLLQNVHREGVAA